SFLPHMANISTPSLVTSGAVSFPTSTPSSTLRSSGGISAELRTTCSRTATSLSWRAKAMPSPQPPKRARTACDSRLRPSAECWRRARGHQKQDRTQGVVVADGLVRFRFHRREDILFPDLQTLLESTAHELRPGHVGPDPVLERGGIEARLRERCCQLVGRPP